MSATADSSPSEESAVRLDRQATLQAAAALCYDDSHAAEKLQKGLKCLILSADWATDCEKLERLGLFARHFRGPLRETLEIPGDLVLLRHSGGDAFGLLHQLEQRWQYLGADGSPLSEDLCLDEEASEAVVMTIPQTKNGPAGFAALTNLWPKLRAAWAEVGLASLFINSGQLMVPLFSMLIYDKVAQNGLFETLWTLVFGMLLYLATDIGMRLVRIWATERISIDLTRNIDEKIWKNLVAQTDLPPGGFAAFLSNYRDLTLSRDFVSSSYLLAIADIPYLLLYLAVIGFIAWPLLIVAVMLILIFSVAGFALHRRLTRRTRDAELSNMHKLAFMGEALSCLDLVRTIPGAGTFLRSWRELAEQTTDAETKKRLTAQHLGRLSAAVQTLTTVVILTTGVYLIHDQLLSVGRLIACNILAGRAMGMVASLFAVTGKWEDFTRSAERMEASLQEISKRDCTPRPEIEGKISVIGLGKHYEGRPAALESVSFTTAPGERLALLGRPGAGKSTLLRCLAGVSRADTGRILIDGLALDDISRFDRVKWLAYKSQDPMVFSGTLEGNLRVAGCTDNQRFAVALWASGLEEEFKSGRMSLGMQLAERGCNLSGGQRQKVALARAFAQPSRILLLDEPTLGLDPESERLLAERMPQLLDKNALLIMTSHSPVMLGLAQRIIALDGGRLVADGPREKLVSLGPARPAAPAKTAQTAC